MAFTDAEKVDIRRFCGYPTHAPYGTTAAGDYGNLETILGKMDDNEIAVARTQYLAVLPGLRAAVTGAGDNLDTDKAAVWTRNRSEVADRRELFDAKRREFCAFLGCQPGPGLRGGGENSARIIRT